MKLLFLAATLSTAAMASELIVVQEFVRHCREQPSRVNENAQTQSEEKCLLITGYPNAKMMGTPVYESRISGWGTGENCSVIMTTSIKASFKCLIGNK
jgi:hypothetical protein